MVSMAHSPVPQVNRKHPIPETSATGATAEGKLWKLKILSHLLFADVSEVGRVPEQIDDLGFTILACQGSAFKPQESRLQNRSSSAECYSGV